MASLPLGLAKVAQGTGEVAPGSQGSTWQGTKDIVSGAAQTAQIPALMVTGPGTEAGAEVASAGASKIFGSVDRAGKLFNEVKAAAPGAVDITDAMSQAATRTQELANTGAKGMPRVISKFVARVTDPEKAPIAWDEARDFYSNVSRLSANEYQSMNPQMAAAVGKFAGAFNDALQATAEGAGKGEQYAQAMDLYRTAKSWQRIGSDVWQGAKRALPFAGGSAVGYQAAKRLSDLLGH
jgi:predicted enzyme related to lactoylglutathione lyase